MLLRSMFCFPDRNYDTKAADTARNFDLDELTESTKMDDPSDRYIEAHVHGLLLMPRDIDALIPDPSYWTTLVVRAAKKLSCAVE